MLKKYTDRNTFFCFSPPVMIATFIIEIALFVYAVFKTHLKSIASKITTATLIFLAVFQLAEYFVCTGSGISELVWSRIGYFAITMLPPLGLHLIHAVSRRKNNYLVFGVYILGAAIALLFAFVPATINAAGCTGNYTIFHLNSFIRIPYGIYYNAMLLLTIILGFYFKNKETDSRIRSSLLWIIIGYLVFYVPTGIIYFANPYLGRAVPSIMCGFAVFYAIVLLVKILPHSPSDVK